MYSKQKSLNFGHYVSNDRVLNKKIHENPKYKHVKSAIDTGKNVRNHIDELKEKQRNCIHKKDEVFKRIKVSAFIKLALAVAIDSLSDENDMVTSPRDSDVPKASEAPERRCIQNVLMGIGELDRLNDRRKCRAASVKSPRKPTPYLLLDVRDRDSFSKCHIVTAKSYPSTMLSRSIAYETDELKTFKNTLCRLIILYDDDESIAPRVATTLVERGYENIFLLSGGLKLALESCPHGLVTSSQMLTPVHMLTQNAVLPAQKNEKEYFSQDDINTIQHCLETYPNIGKNSVCSSVTSRSVKSQLVTSSNRNSLESASTLSRLSTISRSSCNSSTLEQRHQPSASSKSSRLSHTHSNSTKAVEHTNCKSVIDDKTKKPKKTPWK